MRPKSTLRRSALAAALSMLVPLTAYASIAQPSVVIRNAADDMPQLDASPNVAHPHVDAIANGAGVTVAAGLFDTVTQGGRTYTGLTNIVAFDSATGPVETRFRAPI